MRALRRSDRTDGRRMLVANETQGRHRGRKRYAALCMLAAWALLTWSTAALAESERADTAATAEPDAGRLDLARSVAVTGREAFQAGDHETALALFRRAYGLFPAPTLLLYEARSLEKLGEYLEATRVYAKAASEKVGAGSPPQFALAVERARQRGHDLERRIPTLTVQLAGVSRNDPNLEVSINGRAIGAAQLGAAQRLNPGRYRVRAVLRGEVTKESETTLEEGRNVILTFSLGTRSLAPPMPQTELARPQQVSSPLPSKTLAYVAGGIGVAGIGSGVVTGLLSAARHAEARRLCPQGQCTPDGNGAEAADTFRSLRTLSTVSYAVGAAGIAGGVLLLLSGSSGPGESISASVDPEGTGCHVRLRGRF